MENYLRLCETRGLAETTIKGRERELDRWGCWLKRRKPKPKIEEITSEQIIKYIASRTVFHSKCMVYSVISILRGMGEFLVAEGIWKQNALRWIKGPKIDPRSRLPRRVDKEQLKKIWLEAANLKNEYQRILWTMVLGLLYGIGIRRGELERLKISDWDYQTGVLKIDGRKTGRERYVPLPEFAWKCLEAYLPARHNLLERTNHVEETALLISKKGHPLPGIKVWKTIRNLARKSGANLVSVHQFRHTCASDLLEEGVSLPQVQQILGHACITSTCRYTQISDPEKARAIALHPVNLILQNAGANSERSLACSLTH
jgi:site-specific recombinase XerD